MTYSLNDDFASSLTGSETRSTREKECSTLNLRKNKSQKRDKGRGSKEEPRYQNPSPSRIHNLNTDPAIIAKRAASNAARKAATAERNKEKKEQEHYKKKIHALATGGNVSDTGRIYGSETYQRMVQAGRRLGESTQARNSALKRPATHGLKQGQSRRGQRKVVPDLRSWAEDKRIGFLFVHRDFIDLACRYPELSYPERSSDVSCSFHSHITYWTRDFDEEIGDDCFQTQVKGTDWLFKAFEDSLSDVTVYSPKAFIQKRKKFKRVLKALLDMKIRTITNRLQIKLKVKDVLPLRYQSNRSLCQWQKDFKEIFKYTQNEETLLALCKKESRRFINYHDRWLANIFPEHHNVIAYAKELFAPRINSGEEKQWTALAVAEVFARCLKEAKAELNFDDSELAIFRLWRKYCDQARFFHSGKRVDRLKTEKFKGIPKRFAPTSIAGLPGVPVKKRKK